MHTCSLRCRVCRPRGPCPTISPAPVPLAIPLPLKAGVLRAAQPRRQQLVITTRAAASPPTTERQSPTAPPAAPPPRVSPAPAPALSRPPQYFPGPNDPQWPPNRAFAAVALDNLLDTVTDIGRHLGRMDKDVAGVGPSQEQLVPGEHCRALLRLHVSESETPHVMPSGCMQSRCTAMGGGSQL